ncbi:hypothetical protein WR25_14448 isoform H [Diploscapter pachys]|uniref:Beta-galactosidase n=1 Tax=Diploscapter pachys TaxID=2018661 RepID=A0A2A2JGJ7_9BILA|nr:hypothetical protein WR25_14448 isoform H [Diploscapter pachys]
MIRAAGLNAIQVYIPWNFHELYEGIYDFSGQRDFVKFFQLAAANDLTVILRPGPYICAEWENGGLPYWLFKKPGIVLRTSEPTFLNAALGWWDVLLPKIRPLLWNNGGPIIMTQIENEYGSYACDEEYKNALRDKAWQILGNGAVLFTTDPPSDVKCGKIDGVFATVDFGDNGLVNADKYFATQRLYNNNSGPLVNSEYYPGWFQTWGMNKNDIKVSSSSTVVKMFELMYNKGASFNVYMFHGGTNFELWNGAEYDASLITSYDYFAPMTEGGATTEKYLAIRDFITALPDWQYKPLPVPNNPATFAYPKISLAKYGNIHDFYSLIIDNSTAKSPSDGVSFEDLDWPFGLVSYATKITAAANGAKLNAEKSCRDFCYIFVNGVFKGRLSPNYKPNKVSEVNIGDVNVGDQLEIIVENQGRLTYKSAIDRKGLIGSVSISGLVYTKFDTASPLNISLLTNVVQQPANNQFVVGDIFFGEFVLSATNSDTFIDTSNWGKGFIWINGFLIGRYWGTAGPQKSLYIPYPILKSTNRITILEMEKLSSDCLDNARFCTVNMLDTPIPMKTEMISELPVEIILMTFDYLNFESIEKLAWTTRRNMQIVRRNLPMALESKIFVETLSIDPAPNESGGFQINIDLSPFKLMTEYKTGTLPEHTQEMLFDEMEISDFEMICCIRSKEQRKIFERSDDAAFTIFKKFYSHYHSVDHVNRKCFYSWKNFLNTNEMSVRNELLLSKDEDEEDRVPIIDLQVLLSRMHIRELIIVSQVLPFQGAVKEKYNHELFWSLIDILDSSRATFKVKSLICRNLCLREEDRERFQKSSFFQSDLNECSMVAPSFTIEMLKNPQNYKTVIMISSEN